jgi:hypothetical protein
MVLYRSVSCLFCAIILLSSCTKDNEPEISELPQIEFVSLNPTTISESEGPIYFTVSYTDGDGDLGENTPDVKNLFLKDLRNNIEYEYRLQQLAPEGSSIAIQGTFEIELNNTSITDGSNQQTFSYEIRVIDRAGNQSNTITSSPLTVSN